MMTEAQVLSLLQVAQAAIHAELATARAVLARPPTAVEIAIARDCLAAVAETVAAVVLVIDVSARAPPTVN